MLIHEVSLDKKGSKSKLKYTYSDDLLRINLDKKYQKGQDYTIYIKYTARPNEHKGKGSASINAAKGLYFINAQGKDPNKPTQIWTQGETESSSVWFPTIDKPNQKTTQELYMTVPDKYVTLSNGILKSSTKENGGLRTDYWVMDKKHAPYLFFMGVGEYAVVRDKWKNIAVDYYVEKEYEPYAKQIFGMTPEMLDFFSKKLKYEYPWQKYAQIVGRDFVSGAMENTTAVIHGEYANLKAGDLIDENSWENVIAHELFHHWFGDLVTTESWSNLTVNESFANYSEYLWNEYKYGKDVADYHLMDDISAYIHNPSLYNKDLVRFDYKSREDMFDAVSYNKGGGILHMLRNYLGDEAFFDGISDYLKTNEYGTGEAHQLRLSLEKVTGKDLNWFFNQWFFGSGNPKLEVKTAYEPVKKKVVVTINQTQEQYFEFPLTIDIHENGKVRREKVWVDAKSKNDFIFDVAKSPDLINVDADGLIISEIKQDKTPEQFALQYAKTKEYKSKHLALKGAIESIDKSQTALKTVVSALKDPFFRLRIQALRGLDLSKSGQAKLAISEVEKLAKNDPKTLVQAAAINALAKSKNAKYLPIYEKGITALSTAVKAASLSAISQTAPERVNAFIDKIDLSKAPEDTITQLLPTIVDNKVTAQMPHIASFVAFYPFVKFQDAKLGEVSERGFNWIMESDNTQATANVTKVLTQAKSHIPDNPNVKMAIVTIIQSAIAKKTELLKANPTTHQTTGDLFLYLPWCRAFTL